MSILLVISHSFNLSTRKPETWTIFVPNYWGYIIHVRESCHLCSISSINLEFMFSDFSRKINGCTSLRMTDCPFIWILINWFLLNPLFKKAKIRMRSCRFPDFKVLKMTAKNFGCPLSKKLMQSFMVATKLWFQERSTKVLLISQASHLKNTTSRIKQDKTLTNSGRTFLI
jgi:hypothetical protein